MSATAATASGVDAWPVIGSVAPIGVAGGGTTTGGELGGAGGGVDGGVTGGAGSSYR